MRKNELKNKTVVVRLSESELNEIQEFTEMMGIDQSTLIRDCIKSHIKDFNSQYEDIELIPSKVNRSNYGLIGRLTKATSNEDLDHDSIEPFFKNEKLKDIDLIKIGSSNLELTLVDIINLEMFIYRELGVPENHYISWNSPLAGFLINYLRFSKKNLNLRS